MAQIITVPFRDAKDAELTEFLEKNSGIPGGHLTGVMLRARLYDYMTLKRSEGQRNSCIPHSGKTELCAECHSEAIKMHKVI